MEIESKSKRSINKWKIAFFVVIGIIIGALVFLCIRITADREPGLSNKMAEIVQSDASFQIEVNRMQANAIANKFLMDFQENSPVKYEFILEKQALLTGNFVFLGEDIKFYLYFTPSVLENGDLKLKASSVSVGRLEIPKSEILKYVKNNYKLPDWVEVDSVNDSVVLHLSQMQTKNGMSFTLQEIDLVNDKIRLIGSL